LRPQVKIDQDYGGNCIIALGSNLPITPEATASPIGIALKLMVGESIKILKRSHNYRTPAFPAGSGPDFVNGAALCQTNLPVGDLLAVLHEVEAKVGRLRNKRWSARVIDLDLIDFESMVLPSIQEQKHWVNLPLEQQMRVAPEHLILPHPRVQDRLFVLVPMRDVAPNWVHPVSGCSLDHILQGFSADELSEIQRIETKEHGA